MLSQLPASTVSHGKSRHLYAVWKLVQKIAKLCYKHHGDKGNRYIKESPTLAEDVIIRRVSELKLKRATYMHNFEKLAVSGNVFRFRTVIKKGGEVF